MKAIIHIGMVVVFSLIMSLSAKAQTSLSGKQDIAELMKLAGENFDLEQEDAVILFEGKKLYWTDDGRLIDFVHRIIWINTDYAVETYGDHRIPYDSEHCDFHVATVRTWMDNQWWETGETGIVQTTPYALEHAYDYANIQEMMLLHNGIELPCILEIAYYIEDKEPFRSGIDGIWTFAKREPVVWSWFGYGVPDGTEPNVEAAPNLPAPEMEKDEQYNLDVYWWKAELLDKTPVSHIQDPTLDNPYIIYSTWDNWTELGKYINSCIEEAAKFPEKISTDLDSILTDALVTIDSLNAITEYVSSKVRLVNYDNSFWKYSPRTAKRTYETAYAHYIDRTVLVMALLKHVGFKATPIYLANYYGNYYLDIPTKIVRYIPGLNIDNDPFKFCYNPYTNTIMPNTYEIHHNLRFVNQTDKSNTDENGKSSNWEYKINSTLKYNKSKNILSGNGMVESSPGSSLFSNTYGTENTAKSYLDKIISGILSGAKITDFNPIEFALWDTKFSFNCETENLEPDDQERISLTIGSPAGGLADQLPRFVRLSNQYMDRNILLKKPITETVSITLKLDDIELVYKPEDVSLTNDCGKFELKVTEQNKRLTITREISLTKDRYTPDEWDSLRQLLLAYSGERYNTVMFKTEAEESKSED